MNITSITPRSITPFNQINPIQNENENIKDNKENKQSHQRRRNNVLRLNNRVEKLIDMKKVTYYLEMVTNIVYSLSFLVMIFLQIEINLENQMNSIIKNVNTYEEISNIKYFFNRSQVNEYNEMLLFKSSKNNFTIIDKYHLISSVRITQKRYKKKKNVNNKHIQSQKSDIFSFYDIDFSPYSSTIQYEEIGVLDTYKYIKNNSFLNNGGYSIFYSKDKISSLNNSFFSNMTYFQYKENNNYTSNDQLTIYLKEFVSLFDTKFFQPDANTGLLIYDYVIINYELNYIIPVIVYYTFSPSGLIESRIDMSFLRNTLYSTINEKVRIFFEGIFVVSLFIYIYLFTVKLISKSKESYMKYVIALEEEIKVKLIKEILLYQSSLKSPLKNKDKFEKRRGKEKKLKLSQIKNSKIRKKSHSYNKNNIFDRFKAFPSIIKNNLYRNLYKEVEERKPYIINFYIKTTLTYFPFTIISIIISLICILLWSIYIYKHFSFWNNINSSSYTGFNINSENSRSKSLSNQQVDFLFGMGKILYVYKILICLNFIFIFSRLIQVFKKLVVKANIYINSFKSAFHEIVAFLIFCLFIILAISLLIFIHYNRILNLNTNRKQSSSYNSYSLSLNYCIQTVILTAMYDIDDIYIEMYRYSPYLTICLYIINIIIFKFIILKILLGILIYWYNNIVNNHEENNNDKQFKLFKMEKILSIRPDILLIISKFYIKMSIRLINFCLCRGNSLSNNNKKFMVNVGSGHIIRAKNCYQIEYVDYFKNYMKFKNILMDFNHIRLSNRNVQCEINENNISNTINASNQIINNSNISHLSHNRLNENNHKSTPLSKNNEKILFINEENQRYSDIYDIDVHEDILPEDISKCRIKLTDTYKNNRNIYFDSEKDEFSIKRYNEKAYQDKVFRLIIYLLFLVSTVITILYSSNTSYLYFYMNGIRKSLDKLPNDKEKRLNNIDTIGKLDNFLYDTYPNYYLYSNKTNSFTILSNNILVKDGIYYTITKNTWKKTFPYEFGIRNINSDIFTMYNPHKNKSSYMINQNYTMIYSTDKSYQKNGGHIYNLNLFNFHNITKNNSYNDDYILESNKNYKINTNNLNNNNQTSNDTSLTKSNKTNLNLNLEINKTKNFILSKEERSEIIDKYITDIELESVLINYEYEMLIYYLIKLKISEGSRFSYSIIPNLLNLNTNYNQIISYIFDIILVVTFIIFITAFMQRLNRRDKQYNTWYHDEILSLSYITQEVRKHFNSEVFRKLYFQVNFYFLIDLIILSLTIIYIVSRVIFLIYMNKFNYTIQNSFKELSIENIKSDIMYILYYKNIYLYSCLCLIVFQSIRLLYMIDLGKYFRLIITTIHESMTMLIIFVMLLLINQPSFASFSYIAFGSNLEIYSTWSQSFLYTVISLFGKMNFTNLLQTDLGLSQVYFYFYIIIISLLYINMFVATLDRAYNKVKPIISLLVEDYEFKYAFLFCFFKRSKEYVHSKKELENEFENSRFKEPPYMSLYMNNKNISVKLACDIEINKLLMLDDSLNIEITRWNIIESKLLSIKIGGRLNRMKNEEYKKINDTHRFVLYWYILGFFNKAIGNIVNNLFFIEKGMNHLYKFQEKGNLIDGINDLKRENQILINQIIEVEDQIYFQLNDMKKYEDLNNKIRNVNMDLSNETDNDQDDVDDEYNDQYLNDLKKNINYDYDDSLQTTQKLKYNLESDSSNNDKDDYDDENNDKTYKNNEGEDNEDDEDNEDNEDDDESVEYEKKQIKQKYSDIVNMMRRKN